MGLFGSKKKIYVSSSIYNLAGDEKDRVDFLKTTVTGKVIADTGANQGMSETITGSYLRGPGIRLKTFGQWAERTGYNTLLGLQQGSLHLGNSIDTAVLSGQIPVPDNHNVSLQNSDVGTADYTWWADQYVLDHHPERIGTEYASDFDEDTNEITIHYADSSTESFTPTDYFQEENYLYCNYLLTSNDVIGPTIPGIPTTIPDTEPFPSTSGWTEVSLSSVPTAVSLVQKTDVLVTYSDGRPDEVTHTETSVTDTYNKMDNRYRKSTFQGSSPSGSGYVLTSLGSFRYDTQDGTVVDMSPEVSSVNETLPDGTIKTTTTTVVNQTISINKETRTDTQITQSTTSANKIYIYRYGSGNSVLDAMFETKESVGDFLPFIPVRIKNKMIDSSKFVDYLPTITKAYKKATNSKLSKLLEKVKDNDDISDIDYAYCVFGVSLNVKDNASRKYVYKFFEQMHVSLGNDPSYQEFRAKMVVAEASNNHFKEWLAAQSVPSDPLYGTPQPVLIPYPPSPEFKVRLQSNGLMNFNLAVIWKDLTVSSGSGLKEPDKKVGDCWFVLEPEYTYNYDIQNGTQVIVNVEKHNNMVIYLQESKTVWRSIIVTGLYHKNKIYGGKSVTIDAEDALKDTDESGFIVPINRAIMAQMSVKDSTQMATACNIMVFNCYQVVKQKWYQSSWFKVVIVVIAIVITVYTGGAGAGLLGTAEAVGTAIGLTGTAAVIVGAIANALAAMILVKLISVASVAAFGEKDGAIIGAIAGVIAVAVGTEMSGGSGSVTSGFSALTKPENIMQLTMAVGDGYAGYMQQAVNETVQETQELLAKYEDQLATISAKYEAAFGSGGRGIIDPIAITQASTQFIETSDQFLTRTLMTGGDIAAMSQSMIENFAKITTSTELPIGG